jgi:regulator of protease activity HflC (stomatin/prohibitin superfamily)
MSDIKPKAPLSPLGLLGGLLKLLLKLFRFKVVWIPTVILVAVWIGAGSCTTYVPANTYAVRQVVYGSNAGIQKGIMAPGLHFVIPSYERYHLFHRDLQAVNFSDSRSEGSKRSRTASAIKVQTSDGYQVVLDVTVLYRIKDPYQVFTEAGPGRAYEDKLVIPRADRILRKTLGELNSEEFYQGPRRIEKARAAQQQLSTELAANGVEIVAVLVRNYVYDEKYQQLIEGRKIKDQTVFLRQAEAKAAIEERKRDTIIAEGAANQETELARGAGAVSNLRAEADLYKRKKAAEGKLLVELAEAQGTEMKNAALQGNGAENLVGLKLADTLRGVKVLVLPSDGPQGLNPLDLPSLLRKFEVAP